MPEKLTQKTVELRESRYRRDVQPCKKSRMYSSADQQEKFNVFVVFRGITGK